MRRSWNRKWRPRRPGGRRPPTRWIDGSTQSVEGDCRYQPVNLVCGNPPNVPMAPFAGCVEIISGEVDLDWADKSESRLDRIVGWTNFQFQSTIIQSNEVSWPLIRAGILVAEEIDDIASWSPPNLFDHDHLEEFEWMWLWQGEGRSFNTVQEQEYPGLNSTIWGGVDVEMDIRVKRKVGKQDHVILVGQFLHGTAGPFSFGVGMVPMLRCVMVN